MTAPAAPQRDAATLAQVRAARPHASSWVAANAGSGKTRVLTDRVARLLLRRTDPRRILCLTFTRAAAGEMQNRLFGQLGRWSMLEDDALRAELVRLDEPGVARIPADLADARRLFARALETPGGLKIQTIHAFCEALLRRFPLEAGLSPGFEVMDDRLAAQIRAEVLEALAEDPASGFAELAPYILAHDLDRRDALLQAILTARDPIAAGDRRALQRALGLDQPPPEPLAGIEREVLLRILDAQARKGGKTDQATAEALTALMERRNDAVETARKAFLTAEDTPRKTLATKAVLGEVPEASDLLPRIAEAMLRALEHTRAEAALQAAGALNAFARAFLDRHDRVTRARGLVAFDDLIRGARRLLKDGDAADWVRYRLDGGIDHVLVDEAQDTSPAQWAVIDALVQEFFAGEGARDAPRTVFAVGDEKQSIYSFQGARPAAFEAQAAAYADALAGAGAMLQRSELTHSFRSAPPILALVDRVIDGRPVSTAPPPSHQAFHAAMPGRVELWPWLLPDPGAEEAPWHAPVDQPPAGDAQAALARRLAAWLAARLAGGTPLPGRDAPLAPGDVLILVQRRGPLFRAILSALAAEGVPVAGADRLRVAAHLAVRDVLSLMRAVATPEDDLSLAEALRSPLAGLSERDLFGLAHGRRGTLAAALGARAAAFPQAARIWRDLTRNADFLRPHEMIARILIDHGGGARLVARMGPEAAEALAALRDLALDYERAEPPSLTGFLDWMDAGDPELKRQLDPRGGEVRVMTVHGAKGLEAPMVILPETGPRRAGPGRGPVVPLADDAAALAMPRGTGNPRALAEAIEARAAQEAEERWRLFYVAMTRAERWLVVAGAGKDEPDDPDKAWYPAIRAGLAALDAAEEADGTRVLSAGWAGEGRADAAPAPDTLPAIPDWATQGAARETAERPVVPSRDAAAAAGDPAAPKPAEAGPGPEEGAGAAAALARGRRLHLLLEHLPQVPAPDRAARAADLLAEGPEPADPAEVARLLAEAEAVMAAPDLSWIFARPALAEAPVAGRVARLGGRILRGQVDRLLLPPGEVWAIDFKTDAAPPAAGALPAAYAGQLAFYAAALEEVFGAPVRAGVVWTAAGRLDALDADAVSAALNRWDGSLS